MRLIKYQMLASAVMVLFTVTIALSQSAMQRGDASAEKCTLTISQAPELRGLRLGMTREQVKVIFPKLDRVIENSHAVEWLGLLNVRIYPDENNTTDTAKFEDVMSIELGFFDKRLSRIIVTYFKDYKFDNANDFTKKVSEALRVPNAWKVEDYSNNRRVMDCDGFRIYVDSSEPSIWLWDITADSILQKRKEEEKERKRKSFKP